MSPKRAVLASVAFLAIAVPFLDDTTALAHPLGNFSVNHLNAITFEPSRIVNDAVIDMAEIPTAQAMTSVDADGDGETTMGELGAHGASRCDALAAAQSIVVDGLAVAFVAERSSFRFEEGQAGLQTSRLECRLAAAADLTVARTIEYTDSFEVDRVGWHEITANGDQVAIVDSPVAAASVTDGLRSYPVDLLSSPMDVREATLRVRPDASAVVASSSHASAGATSTAVDQAGALSGRFGRLNGIFDDLIARRDLTLGVGMLAVGLAIVLGASHALLPGHGKTVMAAYIAGRQGSIGDAVMVGATVTATHTGGVLLLGLALTVSTSLAGEVVLGWLGVSSGVLVAVLGAALIVGLIRRRVTGRPSRLHDHSHGYGFGQHSHGDHDHDGHAGHDHDHDHDGHAGHDHDHDHDGHAGHHDHERVHQLVLVSAVGAVGRHEEFGSPGRPIANEATGTQAAELAVADVGAEHALPARAFSRRGLIGMGVAGGLVPSPSALIILLSAIALGRTIFGAVLVLAYGLGMALTLTLAGVALVVLRNRYQRRMDESSGRVRASIERWTAIAPYATATLVIVVGVGLTVRSFSLL